MTDFALIRGGVIDNIIVADDPDWLDGYVAREGYDRAVATDGLDPRPAPGWVVSGRSFLPPESLIVEPTAIPPDGTTAATVTYTDNRPEPPGTVDATVNGMPITVTLTGGAGSFDVTSTTPGDSVVVQVGDLSTVVTVEGTA